MKASRGFALLLGLGSAACGLILGIPEAIRDDTIGQDGGKADSGTDSPMSDVSSDQQKQDTSMDDTGTLDTGTDAAKLPVPLMSGNRPWGLAIDDTYLYWSEPTNFIIGRCGKDGSNPVQLATGSMNAFGVHQLVSDNTDVYWAQFTDILKCARGGCSNAPTKVQTNLPNSAFRVAVDSTNVYWEQDVQKTIYKSAKTGGAITPLHNSALTDTVWAIAVDNGFVVAALNDGSVIKVSTGGGTPIVLANPTTSSALNFTIHSGRAYYTLFADPGTIAYTPLNGPVGSTPVALMQRFAYGVTNDGIDLYWTETVTFGPNGNVKKCSLANCGQPIVVASMQNVPKWVLTDTTAIYWTNYGNGNNQGELMKLLK
jgi:hypothetical protein